MDSFLIHGGLALNISGMNFLHHLPQKWFARHILPPGVEFAIWHVETKMFYKISTANIRGESILQNVIFECVEVIFLKCRNEIQLNESIQLKASAHSTPRHWLSCREDYSKPWDFSGILDMLLINPIHIIMDKLILGSYSLETLHGAFPVQHGFENDVTDHGSLCVRSRTF